MLLFSVRWISLFISAIHESPGMDKSAEQSSEIVL